MNKLGKYFSLEEMTVTHENLDNTPGTIQIQKLKELVKNILDPLREMIGEPIIVNSGFRTLAVNNAIGGAKKPISQHTNGEAADIECFDNSKLFQTIRDHFQFDQLIWEKGNNNQPDWVHVSYKANGNRNQILKFKNGTYIRL
jgi:zinc D-Ala-D-Ala carboxypeptidase